MSESPASWRVAWPAIVQFGGEPELVVVRDEHEWKLDPDLYAWPYDPGDRLIDSAGVEYRFVFSGDPGRGSNEIEPTGQRRSAADVQALAERHLAAAGAQVEWLASHLSDVPGGSRIHATILYVAKVVGGADGAADDE